MSAPSVKAIYTKEELACMSLHECYFYGISWIRNDQSLTIDLDYIAGWEESPRRFLFWVSEASLCFAGVSDAVMTLDWTRLANGAQLANECQIYALKQSGTRLTPAGWEEVNWEIELQSPQGGLSLWSTEASLRLRSQPTLQSAPYLRL